MEIVNLTMLVVFSPTVENQATLQKKKSSKKSYDVRYLCDDNSVRDFPYFIHLFNRWLP